MKEVTRERMDAFREYLINEEKSEATVSKYLHDVAVFAEWMGERVWKRSWWWSTKHTCVKNTRLRA